MTIKVGAYPDLVIDRGGNTLAHGNLATSTTVALLIAANPLRSELHISNTSATATEEVYVGGAAVAVTEGALIGLGETKVIKTTAAVYVIANANTPTVSYLEVSQA